MPFLLAEILNFQGSTHRIGVGSFSTLLFKSMKNDTRIQFVVSNTQPKEPGFQGGLALCGRLGQALRSGAYVGFREGQLTLVNHSRS